MKTDPLSRQFDEARKRPLPDVPARIGVVTSPDGAAVADDTDSLFHLAAVVSGAAVN